MVLFASFFVWLLSYRGTNPDVVPIAPLAMTETDYNGTVIIIGAGAAGLFAGYTLEYMGVTNYQILEASNKYGGRIQESAAWLDVPMDLGAEWIHADPSILQDLLLFDDIVNVTTMSYQPQTYNAYVRGRRRRRNFFRHFYREYKFFNTTWHSYLTDYVVPHVASHITYDTVVQSVDYSTNGLVKVTTTTGREYMAEKVICTIPLAVMDQVQFIPNLPLPKFQAISNTYVAPAIKVFVEFSEQFYPDIQGASRISGMVPIVDNEADHNPEYYNAVLGKPTKRHCLGYLSAGTSAEETKLLSDDEIFAKVMGELDGMYDGQASQHYIKHSVHNWYNVPYIKGGYSLDWKDYDWTLAELARPVDRKVYFAGEHTDAEQVATVHGAAMSGRRAAELLVQEATLA